MSRPTIPATLCLALVLVSWMAAACKDEATGPAMGTARVIVATTGAPLDPDGYVVSLDGSAGRPVAVNGAVLFTNLASGNHTVALGGVASNCAVEGANPRVVTVVPPDTARVAAQVTCGGTTGALQITTVTTGAELDPDGYVLAGDSIPQRPITANGTVTLTGLSPGTRSVFLTGIAGNCALTGANPRVVEITAGATMLVTFELACSRTGSVTVTATTTGVALPYGYAVAVDNTEGEAIAVNGTVTFGGLVAGSHLVTLSGVAVNCGYAGANPQPVTVVGGDTAAVFFAVTCGPFPELAFVSARDGNSEIYLINAAGTGLVRLTNDPAADLEPAWSPDGSRIAFATTRDGNSEIYAMNADGSGVVRLTNDPGYDSDPAWSPDGSRIAFQSTRDGNSEIYAMNIDGSGVVRLTNDPGSDGGPAWSPDGSRIAFESDRDGSGPLIYAMNSDGSGVVRLTTYPAFDLNAAWSPDGRKIVFWRDGEIYLMNADGSSPTRLNVSGHDPSWSPDGAKIAFGLVDCDESGYGCIADIGVVNIDGTNLVNLTVDGTSSAPAWRPRVP
jgi:WD40 repeat protein